MNFLGADRLALIFFNWEDGQTSLFSVVSDCCVLTSVLVD